eukprot:jgi/Ulvmu1/9143/UM005_0241.1
MRGKRRAFQQAADATEAVEALRKLHLSATISQSRHVVVAAEPAIIEQLHRYGFGTEARRKQARRSQPGAQPCESRDAPIILEEAFFLQHTIKCLQVAAHQPVSELCQASTELHQQEQPQQGASNATPSDSHRTPLLAPTRLHAGVVIKRGIFVTDAAVTAIEATNASSQPAPQPSQAKSVAIDTGTADAVLASAAHINAAALTSSTPRPDSSSNPELVHDPKKAGSTTAACDESTVVAVTEADGMKDGDQVSKGQPHLANGGLVDLSDEDLWTVCGHDDAEWAYRYATYHHFRSKGWLPKRGEQYGGDWVLYQRHPEVEHADYVVRYIVWPLNGCASTSDSVACDEVGARTSTNMRWPELMATIRVAGQVRKRLVLLYVQFPVDADLAHPECIRHAKVEEVQVGRWVPRMKSS